MININLNFLKDKNDDYIIFNHYQENNYKLYVSLKGYAFKESVLRTDSSQDMEEFLLNIKDEVINKLMTDLSLSSINDIPYLRITANYINIDDINQVYTNKTLDKQKLKDNYSLYRTGVLYILEYPITFKNFKSHPKKVLKLLCSSFIKKPV